MKQERPGREVQESPGFSRGDEVKRGERIAVLERALHLMPRWAAIEALGISGHYASRYLEAVAS